MKKGLSILLLLLFLFNVGGYYLVYWGLRYQTDQHLSKLLDADGFHPHATVELRIPVAFPYPVGTEDFQRVDGRFEHNGAFYKLVKQKLENDTLYIICIRDVETGQLARTVRQYAQLTFGMSGTLPSHRTLHLLSKLVTDYCKDTDLMLQQGEGYVLVIVFGEPVEHFIQPPLTVHSPPPRA